MAKKNQNTRPMKTKKEESQPVKEISKLINNGKYIVDNKDMNIEPIENFRKKETPNIDDIKKEFINEDDSPLKEIKQVLKDSEDESYSLTRKEFHDFVMNEIERSKDDFRVQSSGKSPMSYDAILSVIFTKKGLHKFLDFAKKYISKFDWSKQANPTYKSYFSVITFMIRNMEPDFMCSKSEYLIHLHYPEVAAMYRSCKIFQIEIGEENEDQKFFLDIVNKLEPII